MIHGSIVLKKFFLQQRTISLRRKISTFSAKERESFPSCCDKFNEAMNACPHHGYETWKLVEFFYEGLTMNMKQLLESLCNGQFLSKSRNEALVFYAYVADLAKDRKNLN